jgi:prepilin-type N-terminal cleavage/methylation domain-containing protein
MIYIADGLSISLGNGMLRIEKVGTEGYNDDKIRWDVILERQANMKTSRVWAGHLPLSRGYTFIEMLIVVALLGAFALAIFPAINNALRTRTFDNSAKDILTTMQRAKLMAVRTKLNHRIRFVQTEGVWRYLIEQETTSGVWDRLAGFIEKSIPSDFATTISLPNRAVTFSSLGYVSDFTVNQNTVTLQSDRLKSGGQDDERIVSIYAGGSVLYAKARSS